VQALEQCVNGVWHQAKGVYGEAVLQSRIAKYFDYAIRENWPRQDRSSALATQGDEESATAPIVEGRQPDIFPRKLFGHEMVL